VKFFVILFILSVSFDLYACRPASHFISPTLEESVKKAEHIFIGSVVSLSQIDNKPDHNYIIEFKLIDKIKGTQGQKIILKSHASSCNTFAQRIELNSKCLIFYDKNQNILSSLFDGYPSECQLPEYNSGSTKKEFHEKIELVKKLSK
jgi:hypothetical protein